MDKSVSGLILSFCFDIIIFTILYFLFYHYRKIRSAPPIEEIPHIPINRPYICERNESLRSIYSKLSTIPDSELQKSLGSLPIVFLNFNRHLFFTLSIFSCVGFFILIPVYATGSSDVDSDMNKIGMSHIMSNHNLLMVSVLCIILISVITLALIYIEAQKNTVQGLDPKDIGNYSVLVRGLPQNISAQAAQQEFKRIMKEQFDDYIVHTYVVGDYTWAFQDWKQIQKYQEKLDHYLIYEKVKNKRPVRTIHICKQKDLITCYQDKLQAAQEKYKDDLLQAELSSTGIGFIISDTNQHRNLIIQNFKGKSDSLNSKNWRLKVGCHPSDINWENGSHSEKATQLRKICMNIIFVLVFFVVFSPTGFLHYSEEITGETDMNLFIKSMIIMVLPTLIPLIYKNLIVRFFVERMVNYEKHLTKTHDFISSYQKYVFFLIFYIFLIPAIGISLQGMIIEIISGEEDWRKTFGIGLANSGQFFTMFIFHEAFIGLGFDLLDVTRIFIIKYKQRQAVTEEEMFKAYEAEEYNWVYHFSLSYVIFAIVICMSVIYPLIIIAGLVYFGMKVRYISDSNS